MIIDSGYESERGAWGGSYAREKDTGESDEKGRPASEVHEEGGQMREM